MSRVFLIRIGIDTTNGGFVSPMSDLDSNDYKIIPFPKIRNKSDYYSQISNYLPKDKIIIKGTAITSNKYYQLEFHQDPAFLYNSECFTYGDIKNYNILKNFNKGDFILFYSGFFRCPKDLHNSDYTFNKIKELQKNKKQYYIFAYMKLKDSPKLRKDWDTYDEIKCNFHYSNPSETNQEFVLIGEKAGYINPPFRMDEGTDPKNNHIYIFNNEMHQFLINSKRKSINRAYAECKEEILKKLNLN
ncbi:hypothetical protein HYX02_07610 [Candidatus Woesearchaeota archaeon]|nr:hypothetical protein [Candidatus Woesearchaeota archaeon]